MRNAPERGRALRRRGWGAGLLATAAAAALPAAAPAALAGAAGRAVAATHSYAFAVDSTADAHDANPGARVCATATGTCTLRAALEAASALPTGSLVSVDVPAGSYQLSLGSLEVRANTVQVDGAGAASTVVDAGGAFRVLDVAAAASVTLEALTLSGGNAGGSGYGGGALNAGRLVVEDSDVTGDTAASGGGLSNAGGTLTVLRSKVSDDNDGGGYGGAAIQNGGITNVPGSVKVIDSMFFADTAGGDGGAILNGQNGHPAAPADRVSPVVAWRMTRVRHQSASPAPAAGPGLRLTVTDSTFSSDSSGNAGGGIANEGGTATVSRSDFRNDSARDAVGGALFSYGTLTVTRSTLTGNDSCYGGAIELISGGVASSAAVQKSTLSDNTGCVGGAIDATGSLSISQSTLAGNSAPLGGAVELEGGASASLTNSTVYDDQASVGNGAFETYECASGNLSFDTFAANSDALDLSCSTVTATGVILANSTGANCDGAAPAESTGYNLDSGDSCGLAKSSDLSNAAPRLGGLRSNGGPTRTVALLPGSPAINHGGNRSTGCPSVDQRGVPRPPRAPCDIGSFEKRG